MLLKKNNWEVKKLGEVCDIISGSTPKTNNPQYWDGDYYWVTPAELDGNKWISSTERTITDMGVKSAHLQLLPSGTVLLSSRAPIGKIAITTCPMYCNQGFKNLVCKNVILNEFVYWFLLFSTEYLKSLGTGATFKEISKKVVEQVDVPVPPLPEQYRIVEELDLLSNIIEKKRQQLSELDNLAQSIFYDMFGDPVTNEKGWEVKKLGEVYAINPSKKITLIGIKGDDMVSFLPMEDLPIKACYVTPKQNRTCNEVMSSYTCFANNDVLLAKVTPCFENGKVGIASNLINGVGFGSSEFIVIRPKELAVKEYVYHLVQTDNFVEKACKQFTGTSGLRRVPKQFVEQLKIGIPPLSLQQQFAQKIEAIEKQKALIKQSIAETEELFNSKMDYYFS